MPTFRRFGLGHPHRSGIAKRGPEGLDVLFLSLRDGKRRDIWTREDKIKQCDDSLFLAILVLYGTHTSFVWDCIWPHVCCSVLHCAHLVPCSAVHLAEGLWEPVRVRIIHH